MPWVDPRLEKMADVPEIGRLRCGDRPPAFSLIQSLLTELAVGLRMDSMLPRSHFTHMPPAFRRLALVLALAVA